MTLTIRKAPPAKVATKGRQGRVDPVSRRDFLNKSAAGTAIAALTAAGYTATASGTPLIAAASAARLEPCPASTV
ncbi:MAG: hypothetical protein R3F24_12775 [Gammaproteobacteria bacterium]